MNIWKDIGVRFPSETSTTEKRKRESDSEASCDGALVSSQGVDNGANPSFAATLPDLVPEPIPALSTKARRELSKELDGGRIDMFCRSGGIKRTCEQRCDELDKRCEIYQGLQELEKKCEPKKRYGVF